MNVMPELFWDDNDEKGTAHFYMDCTYLSKSATIRKGIYSEKNKHGLKDNCKLCEARWKKEYERQLEKEKDQKLKEEKRIEEITKGIPWILFGMVLSVIIYRVFF